MEIEGVNENILQVHLNGKYVLILPLEWCKHMSFLHYETKFTHIFKICINNYILKMKSLTDFYFSTLCTIFLEI